MKTMLLIGIIVCVLTLIGVLVYAIKKRTFNLPEIILGVAAAFLSALLTVAFSYATPGNDEAPYAEPTAVTTATTMDSGETEPTATHSGTTGGRATDATLPSITDSVNGDETPTTTHKTDEAKAIPLYETQTYLQEGSITQEVVTSDPRGNTYRNAYVFRAEYTTLNTGGGYYDNPFLEKYLGGKYSRLSLKIVPYKDFDKYDKGVEAYVKIYADEKLIYESDSITRKTDFEEVDLSIEDVNNLRIELNAGTDLTNYFNQYSVIISDARLTK